MQRRGRSRSLLLRERNLQKLLPRILLRERNLQKLLPWVLLRERNLQKLLLRQTMGKETRLWKEEVFVQALMPESKLPRLVCISLFQVALLYKTRNLITVVNVLTVR